MGKRKNRNGPKPATSPAFVPAMQGDPEWTAAYNLDRQVSQARHAMGPERWAELNGEWV